MGVRIPHIGAADADGAYPACFTAFSQTAGALHGLRGKEQPVCPVNEPPVRTGFSEKPGGRLSLNCLNARPDVSPARRAPDTLRRGDADGCNPPAAPRRSSPSSSPSAHAKTAGICAPGPEFPPFFLSLAGRADLAQWLSRVRKAG